jgi:hypothetical protein
MRTLKTDYLDKSVEKEYLSMECREILLPFAEKSVIKEKRNFCPPFETGGGSSGAEFLERPL